MLGWAVESASTVGARPYSFNQWIRLIPHLACISVLYFLIIVPSAGKSPLAWAASTRDRSCVSTDCHTRDRWAFLIFELWFSDFFLKNKLCSMTSVSSAFGSRVPIQFGALWPRRQSLLVTLGFSFRAWTRRFNSLAVRYVGWDEFWASRVCTIIHDTRQSFELFIGSC
jgi:hypothetical protein